MHIPIIHEFVVAVQSLGDAISGRPEFAAQRWAHYSEESVIGSGVRSAAAAIAGNYEEATRLARGMGVATGKAFCVGGHLEYLPVLHELAVAGRSLGDVMEHDGHLKALKRWEDYSEHSVVGTGIRSLQAAIQGNIKEAERLGKNMIQPAAGAAVASAAVVVKVVAPGPLGFLASRLVGKGASAVRNMELNCSSDGMTDQIVLVAEDYQILQDPVTGPEPEPLPAPLSYSQT